MGKVTRRRDQFDDLGLPEREAWTARLRYVGYGDMPLDQAVDKMIEKYKPIS